MPKLIAIEGPDKVGKATQTRLLVKSLRWPSHDVVADPHLGAQPKVRSFEIPYDDGITYDKIYAMLKDGSAKKYPGAFQAFQATNRMNWQRRTYGCDYDYIVLDRWNPSSWVYGRASGLDDDFLSCVLDRIRPADLTIVLDGHPMSEATDSYEADTEFMGEVRKQYRRWAEETGVTIVNANRSRDEVHKEIGSLVRKHFGL